MNRYFKLNYIASFLSLFLLLSCSSKDKKNSLKEDNLRGKVKTVIESSYNGRLYNDVYEKRNLVDQIIKEYDEYGNIITLTKKNAFGFTINIERSYYDSIHRLITRDFYNGQSSFNSKSRTNYDENGNIMEVVISDYNGHNRGGIKYKCGKDGNVYSMEVYPDPNDRWRGQRGGLERMSITFTYDSKGNKIGEVQVKQDLGSTDFIDYLYDSKGNCLRQVRTNNQKDTLGTVEYDYDKNGNKILEVYRNHNKYNNYVIRLVNLQYDSNNNLISYVQTKRNSYNTIDNLTGQVYTKDGDLIVERQITYY
ncbi:RHS repeat domain-containing protein [Chitinophaga sancti]|uniref:YD repeat-containing protein n=1 Tax=Chitinophaga sancti TaxID=1004 RepID=A0A1K1PQP0_9BACT|nr:hypothetical protein [Chitinophaga sancti]WQD61746.1 hypothetical protein U0033_28090 [Chitinophaga sancti]WQG92696.1 hypothetical protein SR876_14350 [Chitinophaga sancti]SFW50008.1 hypothetical protein SAMN05661012_02119 [Chitinophaga sancti]